MPSLTFLGHAGLLVRTPTFTLAFDPWFTAEGAFLGSWHPFPRNDHLDLDVVLQADWVAVSHEHLDHLDAGVLSRLSDRTRVLIPAYPSTTLVDRLRAVGVRRVVRIPAWERFPLDTEGSWLTAIPEQSPMCHDSAFLLETGGRSLLNCNDARLSASQGRRAALEVGGRIDVMPVQTSGASWHPIRYGYSPEAMASIESSKRLNKFRAVMRLVRATRPRLAVPFAGPPCFLDPEIAEHNASLRAPGIFPDAEQAVGWLSEHLPTQDWACFRPGDRLDLDTLDVEPDSTSAGFSYSEGIDAYLAAYAAERAPAIAAAKARFPDAQPGLSELFARHFSRLGSLSPWFCERIGMTLRFVVDGPHGGVWDVTMKDGWVDVDLDGTSPRPNYTITLAGRWLQAVLSGRIGWEDLLLSLRFRSQRDPDVYNDYLFGLLKHGNEPALRAVQQYEDGRDLAETMSVNAGGRRYVVGRYCPHAGEDLAEASVVEGGVLRCLAHNFAFDLASGECVNARCSALSVGPGASTEATAVGGRPSRVSA